MKTLVVFFLAAQLASGCSYFYVDYKLHGIPNYQVVDRNIIRGGQPDDVNTCLYLRDVMHVTKWIKYSYEREASSKVCESVGIVVLHFEMPPSDARDFVMRPALTVVKAALAALLACKANDEVCFEGCLHGRDRTGLMTSLYLWISGEMDKATAWTYGAVDRGLRVVFHELADTYEDFKP